MTLAHGMRNPCDASRIAAAPARSVCPARDKPWVLATAILGSSLAFIEGSIVNLALPSMQSSLRVGSTELLWVINAYLLTLGSGMLIGGALGDRFGLRRIFIIGTTTFGLGALACAVADSLPALVLARLVQGIGGALLVPGSLALIGAHFDEHERGRAIGTWAGASALTTALGPLLGGALVDAWGWPSVFLLVAPLALLTVALAAWRVPVSRPQTDEAPDYLGAVLLALALISLIYALVAQDSARTRWACALLASASGVAFLWRQRTFASPMLPLRLFASRAFTGANLMTLALYFALNGVMYFLPFNLIQIHGHSATMAGVAFLPMTLILGFGSTFAGDVIGKVNARRMLTLGALVTAGGMLLLALPGEDSSSLAGFLPGVILMGVGVTLCVAPLTTLVMSSVNEAEAGVASGVNNTAARLAGVLAITILTTLAIGVFRTTLVRDLEQQQVPPAAIRQLSDQASRLAQLTAPAGADAQLRKSVRESVTTAYVRAFRVVVVFCASLAVLASVIAAAALRETQGSLDTTSTRS